MFYICMFLLLMYVGEICQLCGVLFVGLGEGGVVWFCFICVGGQSVCLFENQYVYYLLFVLNYFFKKDL